jgi:hypothetical protein
MGMRGAHPFRVKVRKIEVSKLDFSHKAPITQLVGITLQNWSSSYFFICKKMATLYRQQAQCEFPEVARIEIVA